MIRNIGTEKFISIWTDFFLYGKRVPEWNLYYKNTSKYFFRLISYVLDILGYLTGRMSFFYSLLWNWLIYLNRSPFLFHNSLLQAIFIYFYSACFSSSFSISFVVFLFFVYISRVSNLRSFYFIYRLHLSLSICGDKSFTFVLSLIHIFSMNLVPSICRSIEVCVFVILSIFSFVNVMNGSYM